MIQIAISGVCGKMGRNVAAGIAERDDCCVCCGIDIHNTGEYSFPVYANITEIQEKPDVLIDYSHPSCLDSLLEFALATGTPVVLATTGYSDEQMQKIQQTAKSVPLFSSFNMSIGIQLLLALSKKAAAVLGNRFDIEIIEKHHNQKIDAPSGTALMIADAIISETMY